MKVITLVVLFGFCSCLDYKDAELKLVHVFFRHGSRTPDKHEVYPTDPYEKNNFHPLGYGQLTNAGKKRAYQLGKLLRNRYESFLSASRVPEVVWAQSTDFERTQMSLLLVMAAMFPPISTEKLDDGLNWIPVPYHYEKYMRDYELRRPVHYCPAYIKELENVLSSDEVRYILHEHSTTFEYVSEHVGKPMKSLMDMFYLYQVLHAEESMNLTLPEWTKIVYPDKVNHLASKQCYFENSNLILKTLNGGRMLKKVIENMLLKVGDTLEPRDRRIYLYSGHDNNVASILSVLNLYNPHVPEFSSAVLIELYSLGVSENYAVKVLYAGDVFAKAEEQHIPGCGVLCPLKQFITMVQPYLPSNYTKECESSILLD